MGSDLKGPSRGGSLFRSARGGPAAGRPGGADAGGDHFLAAVEAAPVPMVLSDPNRADDPIVFANAAFLRLTGYDRAEVVGRNCRFLQGPDTDPGAVEAIRRAVRARGEISVEILNYRKDGTPFRNALSIAPVFDAAGRLVHFVASQFDVSRRRRVEEAQPVGGRAEPGGRAVGDVAHDLGNMLHVVAGHMGPIGDHAAASGDPRLARRVRAVSEAAGRATALVRELRGEPRGAGPGSKTGDTPRDAAVWGQAAVPEPAGTGGRVLVVDDRAEVAELARTMLEGVGYSVEVAVDGQDALDKLERGFDLLFSDVVMPGTLDGVSLAREARRRHPGLKVLLTTGHTGPEMSGQGFAGADFETIGKPYRRSELARTVRRLLDGPGSAG